MAAVGQIHREQPWSTPVRAAIDFKQSKKLKLANLYFNKFFLANWDWRKGREETPAAFTQVMFN